MITRRIMRIRCKWRRINNRKRLLDSHENIRDKCIWTLLYIVITRVTFKLSKIQSFINIKNTFKIICHLIRTLNMIPLLCSLVHENTFYSIKYFSFFIHTLSILLVNAWWDLRMVLINILLHGYIRILLLRYLYSNWNPYIVCLFFHSHSIYTL